MSEVRTRFDLTPEQMPTAWFNLMPDIVGAGMQPLPPLSPQTKEPAADLASTVIEESFRNGLLLIKSGTDGNCIRVLTPLVITDAELDEALGVWEDALAAAIGA